VRSFDLRMDCIPMMGHLEVLAVNRRFRSLRVLSVMIP
jgi:hypothetical protein